MTDELHTVEYWQRIHARVCTKEPLERLIARIETPERYVGIVTRADPKAMAARNASLWMLVGQKQLELGKDG